MISYSIQNAIKSSFISNIVVSSEDYEILSYVSSFPVFLRKRPAELAKDNVTLDPVIYDAVNFMEKKLRKKYSTVITLQPTSPLISLETLDSAIEVFLNEKADTLLPVVNASHLYWKEEKGELVPDYCERLNRQWLQKRYKEAGAVLNYSKSFCRGKQ